MPINPLQVRSTTQEVSAPRTLPSGVTLPFRTGQTTTTVEPNQLSAADAATLLYRMAKDRTDTHRRDMKLLADSALDPAATPEDQSITLREYMRLSPEDRATVDSFVGQGRAKFNQRLATGFTLGTAWNAEQRGLVPAGTYEALKEGARRGQSISIDMTQGTKTELEKQANAISGMRDNVYSILKRWDPNKHAGLNNLLKNRWFTVRDFAGGVPILGEAIGGPLTEEQRAGLQEYVNIRGDMVRTLSDTILARGGTAMTANEEKIIKGFSASPGQSPAEIEANLLTALTIGDVVLGRRALWNLNGQKTPSGRPVEEPWEITELDLANTIVSMVAAEMDQLSESNPDLEGADLHRFATDKVEQQLNLLPGGSQRILRKQGLLRRREE